MENRLMATQMIDISEIKKLAVEVQSKVDDLEKLLNELPDKVEIETHD